MFIPLTFPALRVWLRAAALASVATAIVACSGDAQQTPAENAPAAAATPADTGDAELPPPAAESEMPDDMRAVMYKPFLGDFDEMVKRRLIRVGVTFNRTFYFIDKGVQRGVAYELGKAFEDELNKRFKTGNTKIHVLFVPLPRDGLASALTEGRVDLVVAQVTVRPELQALVDFTTPTRTNVSEVVVTGPGAPAIASVDDLSGKDVWARRDSNFYQSLVALNESLKAKGKPPVVIRDAPGNLEDDDLLEMVNAGLLPIVVVDDYLAEFWKKVFTDLTVHDTVTLRTGASLAVAVRKNSPQLAPPSTRSWRSTGWERRSAT